MVNKEGRVYIEPVCAQSQPKVSTKKETIDNTIYSSAGLGVKLNFVKTSVANYKQQSYV